MTTSRRTSLSSRSSKPSGFRRPSSSIPCPLRIVTISIVSAVLGAVGVGCSSTASEEPNTSAAEATLSGRYEPFAEYASVWFDGVTSYVAEKRDCTENCEEKGSYALSSRTLVLSTPSGAAKSYQLVVGATGKGRVNGLAQPKSLRPMTTAQTGACEPTSSVTAPPSSGTEASNEAPDVPADRADGLLSGESCALLSELAKVMTKGTVSSEANPPEETKRVGGTPPQTVAGLWCPPPTRPKCTYQQVCSGQKCSCSDLSLRQCAQGVAGCYVIKSNCTTKENCFCDWNPMK